VDAEDTEKKNICSGLKDCEIRALTSLYTELRNAYSEFSALLCACPSSRRVFALSLAVVSSKKKRGQTAPPPYRAKRAITLLPPGLSAVFGGDRKIGPAPVVHPNSVLIRAPAIPFGAS
jgi:hypothetical protein